MSVYKTDKFTNNFRIFVTLKPLFINMARKAAYIIAAFLTLTPVFAGAQSVTVSLTDGWRLRHGARDSFGLIPTSGADLTVSWPAKHSDGHRKPWEWGMKANYAHMPGGPAGDRFGLGVFATTPLWESSYAKLSFQSGGGLGYLTRPFPKTLDPDNIYIGSALNCVIDVGPVMEVKDKSGSLVLGAKFVHNSNGYLRKPNTGLNYVQFEMGWRLNDRHRRDTASFSSGSDARTAAYVMVAGGVSVPRDKRAGNSTFLPGYNVQLGIRYAYQPCRSIAAGIDFTYNFAESFPYRQDGRQEPMPLLMGYAVTHETHWGPVSLRVGLGLYPWDDSIGDGIYERVGVFYNTYGRRHRFFGVAIKANYVHADFTEWTYGIDL